MFLSSIEYLDALHEGKYLLFLEWVDFIIHKYELVDADNLVNFLVFEWLSSGYLEDDIQKLEFIHAICAAESKPIQGKLDYSLQTISMASFICMIFRKYRLNLIIDPTKKMTPYEINQFIGQSLAQLNTLTYQEDLAEMQTQFFEKVALIEEKEVIEVIEQINAITQPRYLMEGYILYMEHINLSHDELFTTRLSMAKRFRGYLYEQTEFLPEVAQQILNYTSALRGLYPDQKEKEYLDQISEPSTLEHTWRWAMKIGLSFFGLVLEEKPTEKLAMGSTENLKLN